MKRIWGAALAGVLLVSVAGISLLLGSGPAEAQGERSVTVEVSIGQPGTAADGTACGYSDLIGERVDPPSAQVVITDATGTIVGTVDLLDIFDLTVSEAAKPGTVQQGLCVVTANVELPDSGFYTFTIDGEYRWTVSRSDLEARSWIMPILFKVI